MRIESDVPVLLSTENGTGVQVTITFGEAKPLEGLISINSPLAKALWGRQVGEQIEVRTPRGLVRYLIFAVGELTHHAA